MSEKPEEKKKPSWYEEFKSRNKRPLPNKEIEELRREMADVKKALAELPKTAGDPETKKLIEGLTAQLNQIRDGLKEQGIEI